MAETTKTKYYKIGCRCGSKLMCKSSLTDAMKTDAGWEKKNGNWICDECSWGQS